MSAEPLYEFIKGKGWVATVPAVVTLRCGTVVRLEFRPAKKDEMYDGCGWSTEYFDRNGIPNVELWKSELTKVRYDELIKARGDFDPTTRPRYTQVVAVPL